MTKEFDNKDVSINDLLQSAENTIPDLDGHNIRIAERRILWSKIAQVRGGAPTGAPQPIIPPTVTPEQATAWAQPRTYEEWEEAMKYNQPASNQQVMDQAAWQEANPEDELSKLLRPKGTPEKQAPTGLAHVSKPAPKPAAPKPTPIIELPEMQVEPLPYTPGPGDPNYIGASKNTADLIKVAKYLNSKIAAGKTFEQVSSEHQAAGGDRIDALKGQTDVSKKQYEAILNKGNYLPAELPDNMTVEIRAAIQGGRAVGVTVLTNPPNPKMIGLIDAAVRGLVFPSNPKMDFVITKS